MRTRLIGIILAAWVWPAWTMAQSHDKIVPGARGLLPAGPQAASDIPYTDNRVHQVGNIWLNITNFGMIGGLNGPILDPCTRLQAPTLEFPAGSGISDLWEGSLWIGAVKGRDTLVSVGASIWPIQQHELYPAAYPAGAIQERTTRARLKAPAGSLCPDVLFSKDAKSDLDLIAVSYDTLRSSQLVVSDPDDGRPHLPLGIQVTQTSYSWSLAYAQDFILLDYAIKNVSGEPLKDAYLGVYLDQDIAHPSHGDGWLDDITGFLKTVPSQNDPSQLDTLNMAWGADNDGDPGAGRFDAFSDPHVTGIRILKLPEPRTRITYNWFIGDANSAQDWGPVLKTSKVQFLRSGLGAPFGDVAKYQMMSNGEIDYDQIEAAINHEADGWLPPAEGQLPVQIATGRDIRYLVAAGPFDLPADSTVSLTIAVVAGENFHASPTNFATFFDPLDPEPFKSRLDFSNFALNARWADWVYDTPGFDTDGDGFRGAYRIVNGDTVYYRGDGVPDFSGPPAPPPPGDLRFETRPGKITVRWNGEACENAKDPFSNLADFESYRVYMSRTGLATDYILLAQRDRIDYTRHLWQPQQARWTTPDPPFLLDSLKSMYDTLTLLEYGRPFNPDDFAVPLVSEALRVITLNPHDPSQLDTLYYYFSPFDANLMVNDTQLAQASANGLEVLHTIHRVYPGAAPDSVAYRDDGSAYRPYYEYEFAIDGLQPVEPLYMAVTVSDFGYPGIGLDPLETSPFSSAEVVWPTQSASVVNSERPKPSVYPNPYRLADEYNLRGWEDPRREGLDPERARKMTFTNVPDTCVVSIFSLDGDLVRAIKHHADPQSSDATIVVWDLITRNTQAVKSGLYIWTVESRFGTDVGKLVVIK